MAKSERDSCNCCIQYSHQPLEEIKVFFAFGAAFTAVELESDVARSVRFERFEITNTFCIVDIATAIIKITLFYRLNRSFYLLWFNVVRGKAWTIGNNPKIERFLLISGLFLFMYAFFGRFDQFSVFVAHFKRWKVCFIYINDSNFIFHHF